MKKFGALLLIVFLAIGMLAGCATEPAAEEPAVEEPVAEEPAVEEPAAEEPAAEWTIDINGTMFTQADYDAIDEVEISATKKNKDGTETTQTWKGVPLKAVLDYVGAEGYAVVTCEASDGYAKDIDDMTLVESEGTILGTMVDGEAVSAEDGYIELVMDGKGSNWWIKNLVKITTK
ncbi:molybdopterin-dependent oxidoreductase [Clostridia bacterium]|nr:molybdopterin-dependent oxidoreductase [Clostridia bacterium]